VIRTRYSKRAKRELREIGRYIAADDPIAARAWIARLMNRAFLASVVPRGGRVVPDLDREDVREVFVRSYRIIYRIAKDAIVVLTVFEGHQQFPDDLDPDAK
jgi:toxin ParE1/3/4